MLLPTTRAGQFALGAAACLAVAGLIYYATAGEPKVEKRNPRKNYRYVKRPRKFELSESSLWHTYLQENGYVILKGALSVRECRVALDLVFDYLEALDTGIDRHDPSTWGQENWPDHLGAGILPWYGVGQSKAMWYVRSKAAVRKAFQTIWGGEELLTSFDGMCLFRPWGRDPSWKTASNWYHVDQHPIHQPRFECVQGLVNLLPTSEHTGGNVLIPRSHKTILAHLRKAYPDALSALPQGEDFFEIPADDSILQCTQTDGPVRPAQRLKHTQTYLQPMQPTCGLGRVHVALLFS
jgi:hypothetical protein